MSRSIAISTGKLLANAGTLDESLKSKSNTSDAAVGVLIPPLRIAM
jgi:hypothetical protein